MFARSVAGTVAELSPEAAEKSNLKQGQQVMALVAGGGYAGKLLLVSFSLSLCTDHIVQNTVEPHISVLCQFHREWTCQQLPVFVSTSLS